MKKNILKNIVLISIIITIFSVLEFMSTKNSTLTSENLKKAAFTVNLGGSYGDSYRIDNSPMNVDGFGLVSKGQDIGLTVGFSIPSFYSIPQLGTDFGLGYKNANGTRHTVYFFGQVDYSPRWYNGYFFLGGAFGGGIEQAKGKTFYANDGAGTTATFKTKSNPSFIYNDVRVGTVYPISKHWSFFGQIQETGRVYNLGVKATNYESTGNPFFVLDVLSAKNVDMNVVNLESYMGIQYRW